MTEGDITNIEIPAEALNTPFAEVLWPWITPAREQLKEKAGKQLEHLLPDAQLSMELSLVIRWSELCTPTMQFLLEVEKAGFTLTGETPRERYLNFIKKTFLDPTALNSFFEEYKELKRLKDLFQVFWLNQSTEFLSRLEQDLPALSQHFSGGEPLGKVTKLQLNAGDPHHEGRSVYILTFESGKEILYKPRNLSIVQTFHDFVARLNELKLKTPLTTYQVLNRGDYGWEEKVLHKPCQTEGEVELYFKRAGMYLSLLYLFDGTDVHYENIIASGEHPILIDLETLFHAQIRDGHKEITSEMVRHSVLSVGLLPSFLFGKMKEKGRDISGLGFDEGEIDEVDWENLHTDNLAKVQRKSTKIETNQVLFDGKVIKAADYVESIVSGFHEMYRFMQEYHPSLRDEGWYDSLAKCPVRILLRATRFYGYILQNLYSPQALSCVEKREEFLVLANRRFGIEDQRPEEVSKAERESLSQGDIPCFNTIPSSTDLYSGAKFVAKNCLEKSAIDRVRTRLDQMGEHDCYLQESFIRSSFYAKTTPVNHGAALEKRAELFQKTEGIPTDEEILSFAQEIAIELEKRSYQSEDGTLGWIALEPNLDTEQYQLIPITEHLYSGRAGIALFFAALSRLSGKQEWADASLNTLKGLRNAIHQGKAKQLADANGIGGLTGVGSFIYTLFQVGKLLGKPDLVEEARTLAYCLEDKHLEEDVHYDLIFGNAGLILSLLSFYEYSPDPYVLQLAEKSGAFLSKQTENLIARTQDKILLGLSHGAAGIAYALSKLAAMTGQPTYDQSAEKFLSYERSHFSSERKNWPHLHYQSYPCSWCHGATGVGFARHASQQYREDPHFQKEIDAAIETTKSRLAAGPANLCCGTLGQLEFLQEASAIDRNSAVQTVLSQMLNKKGSDDFYNPGLMQGQAGVGYTLLRLLDTERALPQVLLLK
jgi:type 2 lantibiotic biosynthesis protein LanM